MAARAVIELVGQTLRASCRETGVVGPPVNRTADISIDERRALAMLSDACDCDDYHSAMEGDMDGSTAVQEVEEFASDRTFDSCDRCSAKLERAEIHNFRLRLEPGLNDEPGKLMHMAGWFCLIGPSDKGLCARCAMQWTAARREAMVEAMRKFMERRS